MNFYTIEPPPHLSNYIKCYWSLETEGPGYTHRAMADVCMEMVFHYNGQFNEVYDNRTEPATITALQGPLSKIRRFKIDRPFGMFGIYFYPYALPLLFGIPATELKDQMPDLITLLGHDGHVLEEKMMLAADNNARVRIVTVFLEKLLKKKQYLHHPTCSAIQFIIQSRGHLKIDEVANRYFVSRRQFERKFVEFTGFAPKLFSRIVRFQWASQQSLLCNKSLTEIAYDCGYYDQSHFIHDFKEFSGHHPRLYFSGKAEGTEWKSQS